MTARVPDELRTALLGARTKTRERLFPALLISVAPTTSHPPGSANPGGRPSGENEHRIGPRNPTGLAPLGVRIGRTQTKAPGRPRLSMLDATTAARAATTAREGKRFARNGKIAATTAPPLRAASSAAGTMTILHNVLTAGLIGLEPPTSPDGESGARPAAIVPSAETSNSKATDRKAAKLARPRPPLELREAHPDLPSAGTGNVPLVRRTSGARPKASVPEANRR